MLCDIGNTTYTFYDGKKLQKYAINRFDPSNITDEIYFASVNQTVLEQLEPLKNWHNIEEKVSRKNYYDTMGIDRILCCEAITNGVIVDVGSAITVDVMQDGVFEGGFIYPGINAFQEAFRGISQALDVSFTLKKNSLKKLPKDTKSALEYGFIIPLVEHINSFDLAVVLTGGDGEVLLEFFPQATYDPLLIFKGMQQFL